LVCLAQRFVGERFIEQRVRGPHRLQPAPDQIRQRPGDQVTQESNPFPSALLLQLAKLFNQGILGGIPSDGFKVPLCIPLERSSIPIRIVDPLNRSLSSGTYFSLIHGMNGIAFDFDDPAIPIFCEKTAAGGAFPAGGGVPSRFAGDDIFGGNQVGDEFPRGFGGTTHGRRRAGQRYRLQKVPPRKIRHF
jgi:hypothetical protein